MNWEAISGVSQILGSIVVMISLIYLALQIRQSNRHAQASSEATWMDGWNHVLNGWVADEQTMDALRAGFQDFDGLPRTQQAIFHMRVGTMVNHWVLAGQLAKKDLLSKDVYQACTDFVVAVLATPGGQQYWARDADATPNGRELLELVKSGGSRLPPLTQMLPWWGPEAARAAASNRESA